jgi:ABC-2 type transport system permease protein
LIRDVYTVAWKEWQEYARQDRTTRISPFRSLALVAAGGVFIGWQLDPDFGRSWLTVLLTTFLSIMFVTTVIPDSFAGERERHTLETLLASRLSDRAILLGKVAAAVSYGWAIAMAVLPLGIVAANLIHAGEGLPWFDPEVVAVAVVLSLLVGLLIAGIGVQLSLYAPTVRQAHQRLGFVMVAIFLTPAVVIPTVPAAWWERIDHWLQGVQVVRVAAIGFAALALVGVVLLLVAMHRFQRARLIL